MGFVASVKVRFSDVDNAGIVYYPRFFHLFHLAFEELFRQRLGARAYVDLLDRRRIGFPAVRAEADYKAPLRYPDEFDCSAHVAALGRSSVTYGYEIRRLDGVVAIVGKIVAVAIDLAGRTIPLPEELRTALSAAM